MKNKDIAFQLGELVQQVADLEKHFTNHVSIHLTDRLLHTAYTLAIIIMFCYLKWGK